MIGPAVRRRARRDDHTVGLFVIETIDEAGHWCVRSSCETDRAAFDYAWEVLSRVGGEVRVRQGVRIVAEGQRFVAPESSEPPSQR